MISILLEEHKSLPKGNGYFNLRSVKTANTVQKEHVEHLLNESEVMVATVFDKVTVVSVKLPNGFVITESSGAVSKENYDEKIGKEISLKKIEDRIWELEGYLLQDRYWQNS